MSGKPFPCFCCVLGVLIAPAVASTASATTPQPVDPQLRRVLLKAVSDPESFKDRFDAEVWLADMSRRLRAQVPQASERIKILKTVHEQATRAHLAPELVLAVIDVESNFDRYAISSSSALGLMQVMPFWVKEIGRKNKNLLFNINFNILLGCRILKYYLDKEHGDLVAALELYNGSGGRRDYADRVLDKLRTKWFRM